MIKVGITGGIGSGKSLVCQVFTKLGVPVYYADDEARKLMESDPGIRHDLISILGEDIYSGYSINRAKMAGLIFNNRELLAKVNRIIHPRVSEDFWKWCQAFGDIPYVIQESAILLENEIYRMFDFIVVVTAPEEVRSGRVLSRKGMTPEKMKSIMNNQSQENIKNVNRKLILLNDGKNLILPRILNLHSELMHIR